MISWFSSLLWLLNDMLPKVRNKLNNLEKLSFFLASWKPLPKEQDPYQNSERFCLKRTKTWRVRYGPTTYVIKVVPVPYVPIMATPKLCLFYTLCTNLGLSTSLWPQYILSVGQQLWPYSLDFVVGSCICKSERKGYLIPWREIILGQWGILLSVMFNHNSGIVPHPKFSYFSAKCTVKTRS
jgi:hypothetical protein